MATYTSTQSGPWNDPATWGGGGFPQATADVFNIGHQVTMNLNLDPASVALGQGTLNNGGILTFARDRNTWLPFGHQDLLINNGGWLKVGESGLIIPKTYIAGISWNPTADNTKGLNIASGGKISIYGDPDLFGSDFDSTLTANWTSGKTFTISGDFTTKWAAGQVLLLHKYAVYSSYATDLFLGTIDSMSLSGGDTQVTILEAHPGGTFNAGGYVLNLSRNVVLQKYGAATAPGQVNTNRPRWIDANPTSAQNVTIKDAVILGFAQNGSNNFNLERGVLRNSDRGPNYTTGINFINCILFSNAYNLNGPVNGSFSGYLCGAQTWGISTLTGMDFSNAKLYANANRAFSSGRWLRFIDCEIFGNPIGVGELTFETELINTYIFNNSLYGITTGSSIKMNGGAIGYNPAGTAKANTTDVQFPTKMVLVNVKQPSTLVVTGRNATVSWGRGRIASEHYLQVANAHYVEDAWGDITKVAADGGSSRPTQRAGGSADISEITPQSNCAAATYLELFNVRLWAAAGVSKTYRFYVQSTYVTLPAAEIKLSGEYLDQATGGHLATVSSTQEITTRANQNDWSQYVEVTINPAQDGYINLYLRLMGYEAGKKVWLDPQPWVTGGIGYRPRWSYGEIILEPRGSTYPPGAMEFVNV